LFYEVNAKICGQRSHTQVFTGRSQQQMLHQYASDIPAASRFVLHAACWRRLLRSSLAASSLRSRSAWIFACRLLGNRQCFESLNQSTFPITFINSGLTSCPNPLCGERHRVETRYQQKEPQPRFVLLNYWRSVGVIVQFDLGQRSSILSIIFSAHWRLAAISLSVRGLPCGPPNRSSAVRMCRLARIAAITPMTRLRPSSTLRSVSCSPYIRLGL
jgi:hypothetical protein